jgi:hypothetical protein
MDDLLHLPAGDAMRLVTPDILRNTIVSADPRITDFRLVQTGRSVVALSLLDTLPTDAVERARHSLATLLLSLGIDASIDVSTHRALEVSSRKLRRVERRWQP